MKGRAISIALGAALTLAGGLGMAVAQAGTVTVASGVPSSGDASLDANVTFWLGDASGSLSTLDFSAAKNGNAAYIVTPNKHWSDALSSEAAWISSVSSANTTTNSALFAVPFTVSNTSSPVSLDVSFMVDNGLGDSSQAGLYVDGNAVPNSTWIPSVSGEYFSSIQTFHSDDVRSLLGSGSNHILYFYVYNKPNSGDPNPSGLVFTASVDPVSDSQLVPLPAAAWMGLALLVGLAVGGIWRRRVRGRSLI